MISSRTPEGEPIQCGVCGHASAVEPSCFPIPDATCPRCGSLVWVWPEPSPRAVGEPRAEELLELVARRFGPLSNSSVARIRQMSPAELDALAAVLEPGDADPAGWVGVLEALYAILEPAAAEGTR